jgi:phage protein D/phage baseplate assembly protein gpV
MAKQGVLTSQVHVKINGAELQREVVQKISEIIVDQNTHLPDMFTIRLSDPGLELLDKGPFDLTKELTIEAETEDGKNYSLIKGEITAMEPNFAEGMNADLIVRGYDKLHRLFREIHSRAYLNTKDSDLAQQIASKQGLETSIDPTSTVYNHIFQHNQSDLTFLMQRAWRIGYECLLSEGKLYFRKPPAPSAGITLTWGVDLHTFHPRMTLAEQVDEVSVRGWDSVNQQAIIGRAQSGGLYPKIGEANNGAKWASSFGNGKKVIVDQPVVSQAEANLLAQARLDEISGAFVMAEGEAFRRPDIRAGKYVELKGLGNRLSGMYLVTNATHIYTAEGLREVFKVSGSRSGLLIEQIGQQPINRWIGVVPAIVTNTSDPEQMCRVKVKYPWLADNVESDWARVIGMGSGDNAGLCVIPAVGDEVLVTFIQGDFSQPCILGGLWSGKNKIPKETAGAKSGDEALVRTFRSRKGHVIAVYDNPEKRIEIITSAGQSITLSDKDKKITLKTSQVTLTLEDNKLAIETGSDVEIKAGSNMKINSNANLELNATGNLDIKASGMVSIKGATVNIN